MPSLAVVFLATVAGLLLAALAAIMALRSRGFSHPTTPQMYALALRAGDGHNYWRTVATSEHLTLVCSVPLLKSATLLTSPKARGKKALPSCTTCR